MRPPFAQLFSVHAFIKKDGELKQVPLAFVLMSRRRRKDYVRVLRALMDVMPQRPAVQAVVSDFESALWSAVSKVLPGVHHRGCAFHFCQALWRSIHGVGLQTAYMSDDAVDRVCRKTMALPFLPENVIVWPPSAWSAFKQPVRTNNDVEGWHARLNSRANHGRLNMYQLLYLLHEEAVFVNIGVHLLSAAGTSRLQRNKYTRLHSRLSTLWDDYDAGRRLLTACSRAVKHIRTVIKCFYVYLNVF